MRAWVAVAVAGLACIAGAAGADPRLEASGFVGVDWFGAHTELGNSWAPEQVPHTSSLLGGRLSWLTLPSLPAALQLAIEAELGFAPAFTGDRAAAGRMSYFAPVFVWRAHALLRLARWREIQPHLVLGGGGETVASSSPFMAKDSDPVAYWGAGLGVRLAPSWRLRLDVRHGVMPARDGGVTSTVELQLGVGMTFGAEPPRRSVRVEPPPVDGRGRPTGSAAEWRRGSIDQDRDGDGIIDRLDSCPDEPETFNGVADDDGCPELDPDGDGLVGAADKCPDAAEDFDGFEDQDGCPDPDNDHDGFDDKVDGCPLAAETRNGFEDEDGCPDQLPAEITAALATQIRFEPARARVTAPAAKAMKPVLAMLQARPGLRLAIAGHPERAGSDDLARRRAEAVKWYLVDQGIPEDRIVTSVAEVAPAKRAISFALIVAHP